MSEEVFENKWVATVALIIAAGVFALGMAGIILGLAT